MLLQLRVMYSAGKKEKLTKRDALPADLSSSGLALPAEVTFVLNLIEEPCALLLPDGRMLAANAPLLLFFKLPALQARQHSFLDRVHPEDKAPLIRKLLLAQNKSRAYEAITRLSAIENGYTTHLLRIKCCNSSISLTIKKPSEAQAEDQQFESLATASLIYDKSLNLIRYNQQFCQMLGYTDSELQVIGLNKLLHPQHAPMFNSQMLELASGSKTAFTTELQIRHKNQQYLWVQYTAGLLDRPGEEPYITAIALDISKLKQKETQLVQEQQDMGLFIDRVTHDMKGPLRSLMALHRIVELEYGHDPKVMEYFNHYHSTIGRLNTTVTDLLTLSRVKKGAARMGMVNLRNMVQDCLQSLCHLPDFYRITFTIRIEIKDSVYIEENLLQTIIQNLLENAIKYCSDTAPKVLVCIKLKDDQLVLEVSDNGIGISEEAQAHIFDMFYRATTRSNGTGLGLYILRNAVEKLQGTVKLRSVPHKGSRFIVSIPYQPAAVGAKENA
ncbi:PAS domain-containing sensor histidine kinase [Cesiribacter sp. SM1]|uniref:sensor histidine kinase n=1 Tax=Cesiribacter sp. SM1 TaxID=2861196 RepID=UPI001CD1AA72|nr:PAS domain-containing sensor histidine kinase [Cesiribacter sp. SM1]